MLMRKKNIQYYDDQEAKNKIYKKIYLNNKRLIDKLNYLKMYFNKY